MRLGLGLWIDSPQPASSAGPGTITPTAVYFYDGTHFGVAFDEAISLTGTPSYTCNGNPVVSAGNNPTVNGITCTVSAATTSGSVAVPAGDPAVTSQGGGLFVTAGTYDFDTPPQLAYNVDPEISGDPVAGQTLACNTGSVVGYGYPHARFAYRWQRSANGTTGWADIGGETTDDYDPVTGDVGKYLRCVVSAVVGAVAESSPPVLANSDVVGPITGVWVYETPGAFTFTTPVAGDYLIEAIGGGAVGQSGGTSGTAGHGGGGGASASGIYTFGAGVQIPLTISSDGGAAWAGGTSQSAPGVVVRATGAAENQTGGAAASSLGQVVFDGGDGAAADGSTPGGGGAAASASGAGAAASGATGGAGSGGGGSGGNGGSPGTNGGSPGGGGGGGAPGQPRGVGSPGWVRITWPPP